MNNEAMNNEQKGEEPMNCHERTIAALNRQQPDRVPVFSCTEEQNQIYEILGEESGAVPLSLIQEGFIGPNSCWRAR